MSPRLAKTVPPGSPGAGKPARATSLNAPGDPLKIADEKSLEVGLVVCFRVAAKTICPLAFSPKLVIVLNTTPGSASGTGSPDFTAGSSAPGVPTQIASPKLLSAFHEPQNA